MDPIRFERIQSLFEAAAKLTAADRFGYLRQQEPADPELRAEVLELLRHHDQAGEFMLEGDSDQRRSLSGSGVGDPTHVGPYRIEGRLGEGGMGVVYLAEQTTPVRRQVALKVVKAGMNTTSVLARFERERQALAMMDHDGIAKVFDCGTDDRGHPYFVMELVRGVSIDAYCDSRKLPLDERLQLLQLACDAVQHAHQKGVLHRDIKPSNILVVDQDNDRKIKVIDFGLAKVLDEEFVDTSRATELDRVIGTPEFMSPEQADRQSQDIDTRTDVYSLGVVLYELLVGCLPFAFDELRTKGLDAMRRVICAQESPRPSDRLAGLGDAAAAGAAARGMSLPALLKALRTDLDWVVGKAIDKDRERRYPSVSALAEDLQRFLDHDAVIAGPPSASYRLRKLVQRYRAQILAVGAVLVTAIVGGSWAAWNAVEANAAEAQVTETLRDYELLASVIRTRNAITVAGERLIAWPDKAPGLEDWVQRDATEALRLEPDLDEAIERLADVTSRDVGSTRSAQSARFLRDTLVDVRADMHRLRRETYRSMSARLYWSRHQWQLGLKHPNARHSWPEVRAAIAQNPLYEGAGIELSDADIVGLVPIGENPVTHYWEFYDLRTAWDGHGDPAGIEIPVHRADGSIHVREATGIVFVLLPGGRYVVGPADEETVPGKQPDATDGLPSHQVILKPFFCARHEMTRAQWFRLTGTSPFYYPHAVLHYDDRVVFDDFPAESVSWRMGTQALMAIGCTLPTEAQWEYACRGGTRRAWWPGLRAEDLQDCANIGDQTRARSHPHEGPQAPITDGASILAPAGSYRDNAYGLFNMHGNVIEWCANDYGMPDTGEITSIERQLTVVPQTVPMRGGFFNGSAYEARCARRDHQSPDFRNPITGIRAVRLARHPWRERLLGLDPAALAKSGTEEDWSPETTPRVIPGRWQAMHGTEGDQWMEQVSISETGRFIVSYGKRMGCKGTFRQEAGVAVFESPRYVERWTATGGTWRIEVWRDKESFEADMPPVQTGSAKLEFTVPYVQTGK